MGIFGKNNRRAARLKADDVQMLRLNAMLGYTQKKLAKMFKLSEGQVGRILRGDSWKDLPRPSQERIGEFFRTMKGE